MIFLVYAKAVKSVCLDHGGALPGLAKIINLKLVTS